MSKKDSKTAKKAMKRRRAHLSGIICPKCRHTAADHAAAPLIDYIFPFPLLGISAKSHCAAKNESAGSDGFTRLLPCECDLRPDEVELNANRVVPKTVDEVLQRALKP